MSSRTRHLLLFFSLASIASQVDALDVERAEATYLDKRYTFELVATIDAPIDRVDSILKDYASYPTLDARILESRVM